MRLTETSGAAHAPNFKSVFTSESFEGMYFAIDRLFSLGSIVSSPTVEGGVVYFGSTDGNLYAIELEDSSRLGLKPRAG